MIKKHLSDKANWATAKELVIKSLRALETKAYAEKVKAAAEKAKAAGKAPPPFRPEQGEHYMAMPEGYAFLMKAQARANPAELEKLLQQADADSDAYQIAIELTNELIKNGENVPASLCKFAIEYAGGVRKKPPHKSGPNPDTCISRDAAIIGCIQLLEREGYWPTTRNIASEPESICDLVAEIFNLGKRGYENAAKIWNERIHQHKKSRKKRSQGKSRLLE